MSNSVLIILVIIIIFSLSVFLGYLTGRKSKRAGMIFAAAGLILGVVLTINYFEEVPEIIVATSFAGVVASLFFAVFEVARKEASSHPA